MTARRTLLLCLVAWQPATLASQGASPYVPLHHWAMPYVEHLIARGALADPTPLTRPFDARMPVTSQFCTISTPRRSAPRA